MKRVVAARMLKVMITARRKLGVLLGMAVTLSSTMGLASPLAAPGDATLRSDLTTLADAGVLRAPISAWPLPWGDVLADIDGSPVASLGRMSTLALQRVRARARQETRTQAPRVGGRISLSESPVKIRTFQNTPREEAELAGSLTWVGQRFAFSLNATYVSLDLADSTADDTDLRPDGSFVGVALGNWMLLAGFPDHWWGPGWDGSLILSTNARPIPQVMLGRNSAEPFESRWLRWIGPWALTSFMGQLDDERVVNNALLFGLRFTFKPIPSLEIGLSRTAQWCGDGRPCDWGAFSNLLIGRDNRGVNIDEDEEPGNQLAGFDIRWALPWLDRSTAVYFQWIGEDSRQGGPQIGSWLRQIGAEYSGLAFNGRWSHRTYIEYSDTICREGGLGFSDKKFSCAYEHATYQTGYRYEGRSIGHGMDGQGTSFSIGSIWTGGGDRTWQFSLRHIDTNQGDTPTSGHTVAPVNVTVDEVLAIHARPLWIGTLQIGLGYRDIASVADPALDDSGGFGWLEFVIR